MIKGVFAMNGFYFCQEYDLTRRLDENLGVFPYKGPGTLPPISLESVNSHYAYNAIWWEELAKLDLSTWSTPIIMGLVDQQSLTLPTSTLTLTIISRKDKRRSGMRFLCRGADYDGNTSNYVETEQIMGVGKDGKCTDLYSYVLARGSIPILWQQSPSLHPVPKVKIEDSRTKNNRVFDRHVQNMRKAYNTIHFINLIDKRGAQKDIGEKFTEVVVGSQRAHEEQMQTEEMQKQKIGYTWFDFHAECPSSSLASLHKLVQGMGAEIEHQGNTHVSIGMDKAKLITRQTGIIRVNCMDCLDRTNVVQTVLSRTVLTQQFLSASILPRGDTPASPLPPSLDSLHTSLWISNAHALSNLYAGTGAQKTSFTRDGKKNLLGKITDLGRSVRRYFVNNFYDTYRQNSVDLLLGHYPSSALASISHNSPSSTLFTGLLMAIIPPVITSLYWKIIGEKINYWYIGFIGSISLFLSYQYIVSGANKLWGERIHRDKGYRE
jgi:hypothetical protein